MRTERSRLAAYTHAFAGFDAAGGALLAQDALQPELEGRLWLDEVPTDQGAISVVATKAVSPIPGAASYRCAVNQLLKSVVREIRTLRSVGAGGG
jgi:hypothetical protein